MHQGRRTHQGLQQMGLVRAARHEPRNVDVDHVLRQCADASWKYAAFGMCALAVRARSTSRGRHGRTQTARTPPPRTMPAAAVHRGDQASPHDRRAIECLANPSQNCPLPHRRGSANRARAYSRAVHEIPPKRARNTGRRTPHACARRRGTRATSLRRCLGSRGTRRFDPRHGSGVCQARSGRTGAGRVRGSSGTPARRRVLSPWRGGGGYSLRDGAYGVWDRPLAVGRQSLGHRPGVVPASAWDDVRETRAWAIKINGSDTDEGSGGASSVANDAWHRSAPPTSRASPPCHRCDVAPLPMADEHTPPVISDVRRWSKAGLALPANIVAQMGRRTALSAGYLAIPSHVDRSGEG
ncbi:hypothetical protein WOLCODRAFT_159005 [Wolfiporia cocos MD-104 SS10]|uniref:Uncharacterized protein n=1 Tax=Wolfiporia cocos (strain MD-104) TaxID=742152 RepID=A0A2H3JB72_WOLCO|nr:hypothetical protein WOLCODRAFT_159005 [Wolfiporia cocos MD-104 SS10]